MREADAARIFFQHYPHAAHEPRARDESRQNGRGIQGDWPKPEPLGTELLPVDKFSLDLLPASFRAHVDDVSQRMQTPVDFAGAASVVMLAGCVNRRATIQPKDKDTGWQVVPNLWGGNVGAPGLLKSPLVNAIAAPIRVIDERWRLEHQAAADDFQIQKEKTDLRLKAWAEEVKRTFKKHQPDPLRPETSLIQPTRKRLIVVDATFEKLHEILSQNPAGVLVIRDELTGWIAELERVGREGERAFFLPPGTAILLTPLTGSGGGLSMFPDVA